MESIVKAALFEHAVGMNAIFEPEAYVKPEQRGMDEAMETLDEIDFFPESDDDDDGEE